MMDAPPLECISIDPGSPTSFRNQSWVTSRNQQDGRNGESPATGVQEDSDDLFGDDDDEIFSMISEDSIKIGEEKQQEQPRPSTSYQVGKPSRLAPQSKALETLPDFDEEAGATWIYPLNYPVREYQYSMVLNALFRNTLISLPTGLGKTFIGAVVMYNFYRWYPTCKVVFMAPTKPLVAQQIEACFNIMGIPQQDIAQMTGTLNPEKRIEQWSEKRIFFLTPQVLANDLSRGTCPAKLIRCLVLDEAHRALGNHAYCQVVRGLKEHGHDFRIMALSATPGSDMVAVQQVLTNLFISHVDLRNEDSPDIKEYTFQRTIEKLVVPLGEELTSLKDRYIQVLRVYVNRLLDLNVLHTRDATTLSKFQILKSRECFRQNPPDNVPRARFGVIEGLFALCMTLYHAYELMLQHGIRSYYRFLKETLSNEKSRYFARGELRNNGLFQSIMTELSQKFEADPSVAQTSQQGHSTLFSQVGSPRGPKVTPAAPFIISHPKMVKLLSIVLEHHQKSATEGNSTRIMIFSQYRDSVMEITEMLQRHYPTVKAMSFIGHSTAGLNGKGLSQKKQLQVVSKFREGGYNTLVSTCVGEEGLDIGDVDLIICYDAPKSPIRLVQRMGRTGRKREGRIVVLVTKGKEEQSYDSSQYQKRAINKALANTSRLARYLSSSSPRMVPRGLSPTCLKLHMKVDVWKANTKGCKSTPKDRGSILSMISRAGSSSSKSMSGVALMSPDEREWYQKIRVPSQEVRTLPAPSLMCMDASKRELDFNTEMHINLGSYQPWQSLAQKTHLVGHAPHALNLVELTEFIQLQQHIGPGEDPYGLEMAAFLDKAYVEDTNEENYNLSPDFKKAPNKHPPVLSQGDKEDTKRKRKQSTVSNKRKKTKLVQNSLITDMFNRMTQSQTKDKQKDHQKKKHNALAIGRKQVIGGSQACWKKGPAMIDDDDDVICLVEDDKDLVRSTPRTVKGSQNDRLKQYIRTKEGGRSNTLNQSITKKTLGERHGTSEEDLYFPRPRGRLLSVDILMPPQISDHDDEEIAEPDSPSEVLEFCNNWMERNLKKISNTVQNVSISSHSKDIFEHTVTEAVHRAKNTNANKPTLDINKSLDGDDDARQTETWVSLLGGGEASPVLGKSQKSKSITDTDDNDNICGTPEGAVDLMELSDHDLSPVVGRSSTLHCSSTPKVISKCLFKKFSPGLSAVEEFSPILRKDFNASPSALVRSISKDKGQKGTLRTSSQQISHQNRFKSKLSRFVISEEPEGESGGEISPGAKAKVNSNILPMKGSGKNLQKELHCTEEESSFDANKAEIPRDKLIGEFDKVKSSDVLHSKAPEYKNTSSSLFEKSNTTNSSKKCENQTSEKEIQKKLFSDGNRKFSNTPRNLPQSTWKQKDMNEVGSKIETSALHGEKNKVLKGAEVEPTKIKEKTNELTASSSNDTMEDCSLFEHIDDYEMEPTRSSVMEKLADTTIGVSVTQVLHFMNEKHSHSTQHMSINTPSKSSQKTNRHAENLQKENMRSSGPPSAKCNLSRGKNSRVSEDDESDDFVDAPVHGRSRLSLSKTLSKQSAKSNHTIDMKKTQENLKKKEKHISFCDQEKEEAEEMSESLLADSDFEPIEIPYGLDDVQSDNVSSNRNSGSQYSLSAKDEDLANRTHEESKDQSSIRSISCKKQDDKSKLLSPTQNETQLFVVRKRKVYNVVESDNEDSFVSYDSGKDASKTSSTTTDSSACVTAPLRKAVADQLQSTLEDDDDEDFVALLGPPKQQEQKAKNVRKKKKRKRFDYLDDEAELTKDGEISVSSDESDDEEKEYDRSFVDDGTYLSQDNALDMRAVYLRSVVSPMKINLPPPPKYRHDSDSSELDEEEDEDSFVVDNSFVEYETEYVGDTMLAEDPIINQALQDQGNSKVKKDVDSGKKGKRKRIILNESSSEDDTSVRVSTNFKTPVKVQFSSGMKKTCPSHEVNESSSEDDISLRVSTNFKTPVKVQFSSGMKKTCPSHEVKGLGVGSQVRNTNVTSRNTPSCSKHNLSGGEDFEITKEVMASKPPHGLTKQSGEILPMNSGSEQRLLTNSVKPKDTNSQQRLLTNSVKPKDTNSQQRLLANSVKPKDTNSQQRLLANSVKPKDTNSQQRLLANSVKPKDTNSQQTNKNIVHPMPKKCGSEVNDQQVSRESGRSGGNQGSGNLTKDSSGSGLDVRLNTSLNTGAPPRPADKPSASMSGCPSTLSQSPQIYRSSSSFFVASVPSNTSCTDNQSMVNSTLQEAVGVLVDSSEVNSGGNVLSRLRLHYGAQTAVVHLQHAHYAVSTRMAVIRLSLAVFSSAQHRSKLVQRVQAMLELYERPVLVVEGEAAKASSPAKAAGRSRYLDTIVCACTQVAPLKVLYSKGQDETSYLLWQLILQEKTKEYKISVVPLMNKKRQQMANFYLTLPSIGYPTALTFSQNFTTIKEFINSSTECIQKKGKISYQRAAALKQHLIRRFREDMLP